MPVGRVRDVHCSPIHGIGKKLILAVYQGPLDERDNFRMAQLDFDRNEGEPPVRAADWNAKALTSWENIAVISSMAENVQTS